MEYAAYVGWDWADKEHELAIEDASSGRRSRKKVAGSPGALHEWAAEMRLEYGGRPIAVGIETSRGAVVAALMNYDHIVLYPLNPQSVAKFREALHPSGKKDDPVDAETALEIVAHHRHKFRPLEPADEKTRTLGLLSEQRWKLSKDLTRATNRLRANLKGYFPQALALVGDLATPMALHFLEKWPNLEKVQRARPQTVESFYRLHNSRSRTRIEERLALIHSARSLTDDPAMLSVGMTTTLSQALVIRALTDAIKMVDRQICDVLASHPEHELFRSFPGAGDVYVPRLIAIFGTDRSRFEAAEELQRLTGIAPVTKRTGGKNGTISVHRRIKRSKFLHQTIVEWAGHFSLNSEWGRAYHESQKEKGKSHWAALRALGFKLLRILFRCWKDNTLYDERHHQEELIRRGSPMAKRLAA